MRVDSQRHVPAALSPGKRPGTRCVRDCVGPRAGLDVCGKSRRPPPGFDPRTAPPVAIRYTDWAIPAHCKNKYTSFHYFTQFCILTSFHYFIRFCILTSFYNFIQFCILTGFSILCHFILYHIIYTCGIPQSEYTCIAFYVTVLMAVNGWSI